MSPKESASEKANRLQRKANELQTRSDMNRCIGIMKANPSTVTSVKNQLIALGFWDSGAAEVTVDGKVHANEVVVTAPRLALTDGEVGTAAAAEAAVPAADTVPANLQVEIHRNYLSSWSSMPPKHLSALLGALEPVSLGQGNQKNMLTKGARVVSKKFLLEILELSCNIDPQAPVSQAEVKNLSEIFSMLEKQNERYGRRARDLVLPPNWDTQGVYRIQTFGERLWLRRGVEDMVELLALQPGDAAEQYYLEFNFSEHRAIIKHRHRHEFQQHAVLLFKSSSGVDKPPCKKARRRSPDSGTPSRSGASTCRSTPSKVSYPIENELATAMSSVEGSPQKASEALTSHPRGSNGDPDAAEPPAPVAEEEEDTGEEPTANAAGQLGSTTVEGEAAETGQASEASGALDAAGEQLSGTRTSEAGGSSAAEASGSEGPAVTNAAEADFVPCPPEDLLD